MRAFEKLVRRYLYYPTPLEPYAIPPRWAAGAREVRFASSAGDQIHGLHWPAERGRPTVLFFHGNAQHVFDWALVRQDLEDLDAGLLLVDYPGYGKSTGEPTEASLYAAGAAALDHLTGELAVPPDQVVVFGKSLGGGVATNVAAGRVLRGVVLESTFRSIPAVVRRLIPVVPAGALLQSERYDSLARLTQLRAPLLVVHGTRDALIPVGEGEALFAAAPEPKQLYLVPGAGHNDVAHVAGDAYGRTLRQWLDDSKGRSEGDE